MAMAFLVCAASSELAFLWVPLLAPLLSVDLRAGADPSRMGARSAGSDMSYRYPLPSLPHARIVLIWVGEDTVKYVKLLKGSGVTIILMRLMAT